MRSAAVHIASDIDSPARVITLSRLKEKDPTQKEAAQRLLQSATRDRDWVSLDAVHRRSALAFNQLSNLLSSEDSARRQSGKALLDSLQFENSAINLLVESEKNSGARKAIECLTSKDQVFIFARLTSSEAGLRAIDTIHKWRHQIPDIESLALSMSDSTRKTFGDLLDGTYGSAAKDAVLRELQDPDDRFRMMQLLDLLSDANLHTRKVGKDLLMRLTDANQREWVRSILATPIPSGLFP